MLKAPPGFHFDPFADVRMGRSLFQMSPEDWLVRDSDGNPEGEKPQALSAQHDSAAIAQTPKDIARDQH